MGCGESSPARERAGEGGPGVESRGAPLVDPAFITERARREWPTLPVDLKRWLTEEK